MSLSPLVVRLHPIVELSDDDFYQLCHDRDDDCDLDVDEGLAFALVAETSFDVRAGGGSYGAGTRRSWPPR